ncbi:T9SS C-terminal target domain-containing protein [Paraflavitalea soli]|uniref:T9SS C-terminal target domain-containing protein n=1 Tax=Paraflavitalea soli TaxID=2315862 RepID=A0A3B7MU98_9BACT|nr:S8 family serine peptidase [Paraflavitalea soli]AXY76963.1 T9SS C-terminal target domain-containing protein [Paraflavitalea soli]
MPKQKIVPLFVLLTGFWTSTYAQTVTRTAILQRAATEQAAKEKVLAEHLRKVAKEKNWPLSFKNKNGELVVLTDIDAGGYPIYTSTDNNIDAAATTSTNKLWSGGGLGLTLSGSSASVKGKLGVWDGGRARPTHVELNGRIVNKQNVSISDHTTHVAGTLIASGVNPRAKGMAYGYQDLVVYDFDNNLSEMLLESNNGMLLSNHSYGTICGWYQNTGSNRWEFRGQWNTNEDYKFGYYSTEAEVWDSIAYNAPYHLIVKSSGNNRNQTGPAVGQPYWRYSSSGVLIDAGTRPAGISNNDGYDIIPTSGTAKNILTVGAIQAIPSGYSRPEDAVISSFSSWGPTDDGRIKPDVVADGVNLFSSIGTTDNAYAIYSGTSMATPATAGSLTLLQEYYAQLHSGAFMRSATLKALVIHTADEAGPTAGPDYKYGWGVVNAAKAANVITGANSGNSFLIRENTLNSGAPVSFDVVASGKGILTATLCWTDPRGTPGAQVVNNNAIKLIHDLDIRITKGATTYMPWILDPGVPAAAATTGDNIRDNVEKIEVGDVEPGATYTITISNKGTLARGSQAYSLIVSGAGGAAYCKTSAPTIGNGARIDSVSFGGIQKLNAAGCAGYSNFTNISGAVEPNSTVPLYVRVNACAGGPVDKIVKAWLDFNNDGDFDDAGELLATSPVINGDNVFQTNVTIPAGFAPGNYGVLRVIVQETSNAGDVAPCTPYGKGETQDYRILFTNPSNDIGITTIVSPFSTGCANASQYVSIRFKNVGTTAKSNIVLSGTVKEGANLITNLSGTYVPTVAAAGEVEYTFQTPFAAVAGKTYTISVKAVTAGDQNAGNDEQTTTMVVNTAPAAPVAQAEICNNTSVLLSASNAGSDLMVWYESATATTPIAVGSASATSTVIRADKTYYVGRNDLSGKVGPVNKNTLGVGGYGNATSGNYLKFTTSVPLTIESVKLYVGNPGKVTITVADLGTVNPDGSFTYSPISTTTLAVGATNPTPGPGNQVDNPNDVGAVFAVNLAVPDPGDHILLMQMSDGATLFRNNGVTGSPYPFSIPGVVSITGNSATSTTNPNQFQLFYYFFYDMRVRLNGCASDRVPVVATNSVTPVITLNGSTLSSSVASGNQWYLNSNAIPGALGQTYNATESGIYQTIVTTAMGCNSPSNEITFGVTGIPNIDPSEIGLKVMPNPNDGRFVLDFTVSKKADLNITIMNAVGQKVFINRTPGFIGRYAQTIEAGKLASGVYLLQVEHDHKSYLKKLIVR